MTEKYQKAQKDTEHKMFINLEKIHDSSVPRKVIWEVKYQKDQNVILICRRFCSGLKI